MFFEMPPDAEAGILWENEVNVVTPCIAISSAAMALTL